jgi:hypothetical protein
MSPAEVGKNVLVCVGHLSLGECFPSRHHWPNKKCLEDMHVTKPISLLSRWLTLIKPRLGAQDPDFNSKRNTRSHLEGSRIEIQVSTVEPPGLSSAENPYETLCCLKWGAHYGLISEAAYESGKADLLARL